MQFIRRAVKEWLLKRHNTILSRPPGQFSVTPIKLEQARRRGLKIDFAVDAGAATGGWSREFKAVYPNARILCVEPREDVRSDLERLVADHPDIRIAPMLLGAESGGSQDFHEHGDQSSLLPMGGGQTFGRTRQVSIIRLDDLLEREAMGWPDLIKLDLQGAELTALRGAPQALARAKAILVEASFLPLMEGGPLIADMLRFLGDNSFRCYDVLGLWHRPLDGALAQGDLLFVRDDSPLLADRRWNAQGTVA